jgi:hypothetical protein
MRRGLFGEGSCTRISKDPDSVLGQVSIVRGGETGDVQRFIQSENLSGID